ncbi:MAG TPA: YdcF family protein, partial [Acidimicrobiales bacterium]|nr:YdcF family protein [Acidimicrobiales bacterium]
MLFGPLKLALRLAGLLFGAIFLYFVVTLVQVWLTSTEYAPRQAGAIMVMGAAQYNGKPSPDLQARLNEALTLFKLGDAPLIMVTGGKEPADLHTESEAGATYLESHGVPAQDILQAGGRDSYENIADA